MYHRITYNIKDKPNALVRLVGRERAIYNDNNIMLLYGTWFSLNNIDSRDHISTLIYKIIRKRAVLSII